MASNLNKECYLLFDVGGTFLKAFLADSNRNLIADSEFSVPMPSDGSKDEIIGSLVTAVTRGFAFALERGLHIAGVALDFPGPFDYNRGVSLMEHKFQAIHSVNLAEVICSVPTLSTEIPVRFMHDVNAALLGEMTFGNARGYGNVAIVTLGTGLGFSCAIDSEIQVSEFGSPRISIFRTPYGGGILEDFVSKRGITRLYHEFGGEDDLTVAQIAGKAFEGDEVARKAFEAAGKILGESIAPILNENGIECLIFGGQISKSFDLFAPTLRKELECVASLKTITKASSITSAPFFGLLKSLT